MDLWARRQRTKPCLGCGGTIPARKLHGRNWERVQFCSSGCRHGFYNRRAAEQQRAARAAETKRCALCGGWIERGERARGSWRRLRFCSERCERAAEDPEARAAILAELRRERAELDARIAALEAGAGVGAWGRENATTAPESS